MIKIVKLVTGEDVVADIEFLDDADGKKVLMKNPQRFIMTQEGLGSIPLIPFSNDKDFCVNMAHVVLIAEPDNDVKNGYNSQYGSGIVVASSGKIIT